jgi:hypothetical protein
MSHDDYYRQHLPEHLDPQGDLAPPWEEFPQYERHTIGWRMGSGESWLGFFGLFLEKLPTDFDTRLAYLRRHAKAPYTWSESVHHVLYPNDIDDDDDDDDDDDGEKERAGKRERRVKLVEMGLVAEDIAYFTWRKKQIEVAWPWDHSETPIDAGRYWTRDLWFWSRHVAELRSGGEIPAFEAPEAWQEIAQIVRHGKTPTVAPKDGLSSLVRNLAAGTMVAPWQIGLSLEDFGDTFDMDMGYVDAFRLWGMSAFDDKPTIERFQRETRMPESWSAWMDEQFFLD